jgi:hypothetical protein
MLVAGRGIYKGVLKKQVQDALTLNSNVHIQVATVR